MMKYQRVDYRISLLRTAAFHGSSDPSLARFSAVSSDLEGKSVHIVDLDVIRTGIAFPGLY